jgi:cysteinyl-tRNA synthetase
LEQWEARVALLKRALTASGGGPDRLRVEPRRLEFMDAMDDDFDTPRAVEIVTGIARGLIEGQLDARTAIPTLLELTDVLGLRLGRE